MMGLDYTLEGAFLTQHWKITFKLFTLKIFIYLIINIILNSYRVIQFQGINPS